MTTAQAIERKYALTRVAAGDYLLPSNDGQTIWRVRKYEDGPSSGIMDWPQDRTFWGIWKWASPVRWDAVESRLGHTDPLEEQFWTFWDGTYATRSEAIQAALRASP